MKRIFKLLFFKPKWEYRIIKVDAFFAPVGNFLTDAGNDGWELVVADLGKGGYIFKRRKV